MTAQTERLERSYAVDVASETAQDTLFIKAFSPDEASEIAQREIDNGYSPDFKVKDVAPLS